MPGSLPTVEIPSRLRDQAISALVPFFADIGGHNQEAARVVARDLLDEYRATTPKELQLAAQIIALGFAALACLSAAMLAKADAFEEMMRLQGYAIALDRGSQKSAKALEARRRDRTGRTPEDTAWDEGAFQSAIGQALEKMTEANTRIAAFAARREPVEPRLKLPLMLAEPMTQGVLARRRRSQKM